MLILEYVRVDNEIKDGVSFPREGEKTSKGYCQPGSESLRFLISYTLIHVKTSPPFGG